MSNTRIEFVDTNLIPAKKYNYPGPFKNLRYEVMPSYHIRFTIVKDLNFLTYDAEFAFVISKLRNNIIVNVYETFGEAEYKIRSLKCNFVQYLLDERPDASGDIIREEIFAWEVIEIL